METLHGLPANEHEFTIDIIGDTTNMPRIGTFKAVCMPTLRQKAEISLLESQLNRDLVTVDEATVIYHRMIAQISVRLKSAPDWWKAANNGQDLLDFNVIAEVFKHCIEAEKAWKEKVWQKKEDDVPK